MSRNRRPGMIRPGARPGTHDPIVTAPGSTYRNGLPVRYYPLRDGGEPIPELPALPASQPPAAVAAPSGEVLPVVDVRLVLCPLCAADLCGFGCFEGPCKCACRDGRTA